MLQLLKNLKSHSPVKEMTDGDILKWANKKVKSTGRTSKIESFKDKSLSTGKFFLELLSAVEPRVVNWNLVTKGESDAEKKLNATYIISVARKLGCSIFLLPEDIMEVNQKMILTLTASIMYWSLQQQGDESDSTISATTSTATSPAASPEPSINGDCEESSSLLGEVSNSTVDEEGGETTSLVVQASNITADDLESEDARSSMGEVLNPTPDAVDDKDSPSLFGKVASLNINHVKDEGSLSSVEHVSNRTVDDIEGVDSVLTEEKTSSSVTDDADSGFKISSQVGTDKESNKENGQ